MRWKRLFTIGISGLLMIMSSGCSEIKVIQYEQGGLEGQSSLENDDSQDSEDAIDEENKGSSENSERMLSEQNSENAQDSSKQQGAIIETVDRPLEEYAAISNQLESWWFKRNEEHACPGCQEDFDIAPYNAYYVDKDAKESVLYLTFDCGYENGYTEKMLDILKENHVTALFFVTQHYIETNPELVKRMKEDGHLVGNHTNHHPSLPQLSIEEQREELQSCAACMKEMTGYDMDPYMRPPKGEYSERTLQLCKDMGYTTIFWSMAYLDYEVDNQPTPEYVVEHFDKYIHPGAIPLMHNVSSANAEALPTIIEHLREAGYRFGSVNELCR